MGQEEVVMTNKTMRAHIVIDKDLIDEVDRLVGPRHRSEFIAEAVAKKLAQERLLRAALKVGGSLEDVDIPGWETSESTIEWVRSLRRERDKNIREESNE
jgi:metal-responsive CopG/Arc/MetJ family transcriptional regulator